LQLADWDNHLQNILGANGTVQVLVKRDDGAKILKERSFVDKKFKAIGARPTTLRQLGNDG
jgi:hypothetical protein